VRSYDRADRVFQAMLCRGFHGVFYSLRTFSWQRRDWVFVATSLPALAVILYLEWHDPALL
jgi:cobalt/nickel transport system permease protein